MLKIESDRLVPVDWDYYTKEISRGFNLTLKWIVARNLLELTRLLTNPSDCPTFARLWYGVKAEDMVVRQQMFAMQTIASTIELTENFAAMCFAYAEAVKNGAKFLPLLLRDFGNKKKAKQYRGTSINWSFGTANKLFNEMLKSGNALRKYLACQDESLGALGFKRNVIKKIVEFREKYGIWYNKFKHTNSVWAFKGLFNVPGILSILHRIPDHLKWSNKKVTFKDEPIFESITKDESAVLGIRVSHLQIDSFLTAYQNLDDVAVILGLLEDFWQPIKEKQHNALFRTTISE
ncbi:MAG: hypothetical protein L6N96_07165 [Candidatus Methylarchaceae archaeon HK02M2]|nr:hypothetical protein [Candidatus Methylarchaceae archaeon HK02M2]